MIEIATEQTNINTASTRYIIMKANQNGAGNVLPTGNVQARGNGLPACNELPAGNEHCMQGSIHCQQAMHRRGTMTQW